MTHKTPSPTVLIILDGWGYREDTRDNAIANATTPVWNRLWAEAPHTLISTSGLDVGLPAGQMGNSEVGHMSIGSGRVLYQDLVKISLALNENSMKDNEELKNLLNASNRLHLIGLMSDGGVHSHIDHFMGLAEIAAKEGKEVFLHLITVGRDVSLTSAQKYLAQVETQKENMNLAKQVYDVNKLSYQEGVASLNELLDTETSLKQAQAQYVNALFNFKLAELDYFKASGQLVQLIKNN